MEIDWRNEECRQNPKNNCLIGKAKAKEQKGTAGTKGKSSARCRVAGKGKNNDPHEVHT